jgi:NAD(P)-dependent dehydrogenase (short-subunit alcohol dehydrogenase family)
MAGFGTRPVSKKCRIPILKSFVKTSRYFAMNTEPLVTSPFEKLRGKRALVTGGGGGIGRAICLALAGAGARVAVTDRDPSAAAAVALELGAQHLSTICDVTSSISVQDAFGFAATALGGLDIVCANAGVSTMNRVGDLSEDEWDFNMTVNAKGVFLTNQAAVRLWEGTGTSGVIVNTASVAGKVGAPLLAHYCASKFAVIGFTQSLAKEVAGAGIRVNCVCPGYVRTAMQSREIDWEAKLRGMTPGAVRAEYLSLTPLRRLEEPEDVADAVLFLASDSARFITGEALNVSGGAYMD